MSTEETPRPIYGEAVDRIQHNAKGLAQLVMDAADDYGHSKTYLKQALDAIRRECDVLDALASPRVDQPAPARMAADAKEGDPVWVLHGESVVKATVDSCDSCQPIVWIDATYADGSSGIYGHSHSSFGTKWGFIEEQQL